MTDNKLKRYILLFLIIGTVCLFIFCFLIYFSINNLKEYKIFDSQISINEVTNHIGKVEVEGNNILIEGWAIVKNSEIRKFETNFIIFEEQTDKFYKVPSTMKLRPDVTQHFTDDSNVNYDKCGILGILKANKLKFPLDTYKIYILYKNDDYNFIVDTGKFLLQKEI